MIAPDWIEYENANGGRFSLSGSAEEIISQVKQLSARVAPSETVPDNLTIENRRAGAIGIRVYTPKIQNASHQLPVCLFSHGGGFIAGSLDSEDDFCRWIATTIGCIVVSIDYRLGPDNKLPTMLEDVVSVYKWVCQPENALLGEEAQLFAMGGSAGGALSLALANYICREHANGTQLRKLDGVIALTPITLHPDNVPAEHVAGYTSYTENADAPIMGSHAMRIYLSAVDAVPTDESIFTALSPRLADFPPVYVGTCGADPLRDDGLVIVNLLRKSGIKVVADHYTGYPHIFWIFRQFAGSALFYENLERGIKSILQII